LQIYFSSSLARKHSIDRRIIAANRKVSNINRGVLKMHHFLKGSISTKYRICSRIGKHLQFQRNCSIARKEKMVFGETVFYIKSKEQFKILN